MIYEMMSVNRYKMTEAQLHDIHEELVTFTERISGMHNR